MARIALKSLIQLEYLGLGQLREFVANLTWLFKAKCWERMAWKGTLVMSEIIKRLMITLIHDLAATGSRTKILARQTILI
jgi:hypothetical protein